MPRRFHPRRRLSPLEWGLALGLLDALFLAFVLVQFAVLFGGHDRVLETAELTYAEYAREGFWQLLAAAGLTLGVIGLTAWLADAPSRGDRAILRALVGILCGLTIVVLVSSIRRLELYEDAFGLTRARLSAEATALWLANVFALIVVGGLQHRVRRRLAPVAIVGSALLLLGFALANPDRLVAERNVERWRETGQIDLDYARSLSADAAPALASLPSHLRTRALAQTAARLEDADAWGSLNLSREQARAVVAEE